MIKTKNKYYKYLTNPNTNSFFISPTSSTNGDKVRPVETGRKGQGWGQMVLGKKTYFKEVTDHL